MKIRMLAIKLLCDLRGMSQEELSGDEVDFVIKVMSEAHALGYLDGVNALMGKAMQPELCETCSDGGHEEGR
jgi:hypothetical protein